MIGAMITASNTIKCFPLCFHIAVQHGLFQPLAISSAILGMLPASGVTNVIAIRSIDGWHRRIILLDSSLHFIKQAFPKALHRFQKDVGVGILRNQISADFRIKDRWILHHFLPFFILEPSVVINPHIAKAGFGNRVAARGWGRGCHIYSRKVQYQ